MGQYRVWVFGIGFYASACFVLQIWRILEEQVSSSILMNPTDAALGLYLVEKMC